MCSHDRRFSLCHCVYSQLAWAPAKGAKEYKDHFNKELGVTYIPIAKLEKSSDTITTLSEGGWIDPRTITESLKKSKLFRVLFTVLVVNL